MAHFEDLSECSFLPGPAGRGFKAVGWLQRDHAYRTDEVTEVFFEKLLGLLQNPWTPPIATGGYHHCDLCQFSGGRAEFACGFGKDNSRSYRFGGTSSGILFVPHSGVLFVSPLNIAHYIDAHGYCPPKEFRHAVANCPAMRSADYMRELLATPARDWLRTLTAV